MTRRQPASPPAAWLLVIALLWSPLALADALLLSYDVRPENLAWPEDAPPRVRVFADGEVRVHFPHFMRRAGDYRARLDADELAVLHALLEAAALADLSSAELAADLAAADAERRRRTGDLALVSDPTRHVFQVFAGEGPNTPVNTVVIEDLDPAARRHPELVRLQALDRLQDLLLALSTDPRLAPVEPPR